MDKSLGFYFKGQTSDEGSSPNHQQSLHPQISKQEVQSYLMHIKYYYYLVNRHLKLIKRYIEQLSEMKNYHLLRKHLQIITQDQQNWYGKIDLDVMGELCDLIKDKIHQKYSQMQQKKKLFYESVLIYNKMLLRNYDQSCKILQKDPAIFHMFFLDIMSVFLRNSFEYRKIIKNKHILIKSQFVHNVFNFNKKQCDMLIKAFRNCLEYVKYDVDVVFQELAIIYQIFRVKNRINYFDQITKQTIDYQLNKEQCKNLIPQTVKSNQYQYTFCWLAYISYQKTIISYPYKTRILIMKYFNTVFQQQTDDQAKKKILLCIKFKFSLSFQSFFVIKDLFEKKQLDEISKILCLPESQQIDQGFQRPLPVIFLTDDSYSQAFQKFGLKQKYGLQQFQRQPQTKLHYAQKIVNVAFRQYKHLGILMKNMLKIEQYNKRQLIVIRRMAISYKDLKKKSVKSKDSKAHKIKDLVCHLILVTNGRQITSLFVIRQDMDDWRYLKILKAQSKKFIPVQGKNCVLIMYENQIGANIEWRQFDRFFANMHRLHGVKVYVTNIRHYSVFNIFILCHIRMKLQQVAPVITKDNFYDVVKNEAYQIIMQLRKKRFTK